MMFLHLVKKDILIAKKLVLITMFLMIVIPLFFMCFVPELSGFPVFLYMIIMIEIMLLQSISQLEAKNPKAPALLCAAPYTRKAFVKSKYVLFILLFAYCYIGHTILALIINPLKILDLTSLLCVMLCSVTIYGIYMPVEFKYGAVKARYFSSAIILVLSLGPTIFLNLFSSINFSEILKSIESIPAAVKYITLSLLSILSFITSMVISMRIFANKEL